MRVSFLISLLVSSLSSFSQDYTLERNSLTGVISVYQNPSPLNRYTKQKISEIKRNSLSGNIDIYSESSTQYFQQTTHPLFTNKSNIEAVQPYLSPIATSLNVINNLNSIRTDKNYINNNYIANQKSENCFRKIINEAIAQENEIRKFYSQISNKPKFLKDGWYNAMMISSNPTAALDVMKKTVTTSYIKVVANKIVDNIAYSNMDSKITMYLEDKEIKITYSDIVECKSYYTHQNNAGQRTFCEIFFLDALFGNDATTILPEFGSYTFNSNLNNILIKIYETKPQNENTEIALACTTNSEFSFTPGTYYYIATTIDGSNIKWANYFTVINGQKGATTLVLK